MAVEEHSQAPGKAFEQRVVDAYQALGFRVTPNVQLPGKQTDLVARQDVPGASPIKLAIECKDHASPVGNQEVHEFIHRVVAQTANATITEGVLVSASGFTADARAAAEGQPRVTLLSWAELSSRIFDVRHQVREAVERYETSAIFQNYLPLAIELLKWSGLKPETSREISGETLLAEWFGFDGEAGLGTILALADFGAGKTTLLRNIEYARAKAYLAGKDDRVPLFVPLREYRQSQDIGTLLRASFRDAYFRDIPVELLWQRIESGNLFVLLDGFDEMLDRSTAKRRLELFHELMPVMRSRSPAILTSRPSYLVERGELDQLLATLREREAAISAPLSVGGPHSLAMAERLRRNLVERHREVRPTPGAFESLNPRDVQVIRLLPLDEQQIDEFVARHSGDLAEVGASVPELLDFIKRTYDLSDLASRPMLLNLIISSVVIGGLDIADTSTQYGASSLYEIYTHAKLDLDLAKGHNRQGGLSLTTRRLLAEAVAIEMYENNVLELDFHTLLERLRSKFGPLKDALDGTGLSEEEIKADFATCSFVTLDQEGNCRFVHKSFRGFFIARVLKSQLPQLHPLLHEHLEREVLYFLGNFSPTEPGVGEKLWAKFLHVKDEERTLKRNLLVAFLNTKPTHDTRRIANGVVADAEFGRLAFEGTRLKDVQWADTVVRDLRVKEAKWKVGLVGTNFIRFLTEGGALEMDMEGSEIEAWKCEGGNLKLTGARSKIYSWELKDATARLRVTEDCLIDELKASKSDLALSARTGFPLTLADVKIDQSRMRLSGEWAPASLQAQHSLLVYGGPQDLIGRWELDECLLVLEGALEDGPTSLRSSRHPISCDPDTVILAPEGISHNLLSSRVGIFGSVQPISSRRPFELRLRAWGVLAADDVLDAAGVPLDQPGGRVGDLLLVRNRPSLDAELSALSELDHLSGRALQGVGALDLVARKRRELKAQHEELLKRPWPDLRKLLVTER